MWLIGIRSNRETAMAVGEKSRNVVIIKGTAPKVRPPKLDNSASMSLPGLSQRLFKTTRAKLVLVSSEQSRSASLSAASRYRNGCSTFALTDALRFSKSAS